MWSTGYYGYLSDYLWWWMVLGSVVVHTWCFFRLTTGKRSPRLRLIIGNFLVALCMLTAIGLALESYLRFLSVQTDSFGVTLTSKRWFALYPKLNSLSYRDKEWAEEKPNGIRRVAFVGDSFTYGWGVNNREDLFTSVIQAGFDRRKPGAVEVMNVAWCAWDTSDHAKAVRQMIMVYDIDEVVLCHLPNDIEKLLPTGNNFDPVHPPKCDYLNTESSFPLDYLYHRIYARRIPSVRNYFDWLANWLRQPGHLARAGGPLRSNHPNMRGGRRPASRGTPAVSRRLSRTL